MAPAPARLARGDGAHGGSGGATAYRTTGADVPRNLSQQDGFINQRTCGNDSDFDGSSAQITTFGGNSYRQHLSFRETYQNSLSAAHLLHTRCRRPPAQQHRFLAQTSFTPGGERREEAGLSEGRGRRDDGSCNSLHGTSCERTDTRRLLPGRSMPLRVRRASGPVLQPSSPAGEILHSAENRRGVAPGPHHRRVRGGVHRPREQRLRPPGHGVQERRRAVPVAVSPRQRRGAFSRDVFTHTAKERGSSRDHRTREGIVRRVRGRGTSVVRLLHDLRLRGERRDLQRLRQSSPRRRGFLHGMRRAGGDELPVLWERGPHRRRILHGVRRFIVTYGYIGGRIMETDTGMRDFSGGA